MLRLSGGSALSAGARLRRSEGLTEEARRANTGRLLAQGDPDAVLLHGNPYAAEYGTRGGDAAVEHRTLREWASRGKFLEPQRHRLVAAADRLSWAGAHVPSEAQREWMATRMAIDAERAHIEERLRLAVSAPAGTARRRLPVREHEFDTLLRRRAEAQELLRERFDDDYPLRRTMGGGAAGDGFC